MTVFSTGSYSGATTAEIAREAGISEPILYRHFASKRELYFACLDEAWVQLRQIFNDKLAGALPTPGETCVCWAKIEDAQTNVANRNRERCFIAKISALIVCWGRK